MNSVIIGNGESRSWFNPEIKREEWVDIETWGCNAVYREASPDHIVAMDYAMQQEIYDSGYALKNNCYFANWNVVPSEVAEMTLMGYDIPQEFIHRNNKQTEQCVIQGKDPNTLKEKIELTIKKFPNLDIKDLTLKMEKDVGIWITYVEETDQVTPIVGRNGYSTGNAAMSLACESGSKKVYMLGFDLSAYNEDLNNIYKGTDNYFPSGTKGFNPINWIDQMQAIFTKYDDVDFYWVDAIDRFGQKDFFHNSKDGDKNMINYITKEEFCQELNLKYI